MPILPLLLSSCDIKKVVKHRGPPEVYTVLSDSFP